MDRVQTRRPRAAAAARGARSEAAPLAQSTTTRIPSRPASAASVRMGEVALPPVADRPYCAKRSDGSPRSSRAASISSSTSSGNFVPAASKNLMPLYSGGLCEAEMTTPLEAPRSVVRNAIAGVGSTPAMNASPPASPCLPRGHPRAIRPRSRVATDDERRVTLAAALQHDDGGPPEAIGEPFGELGPRQPDPVGAEQPFRHQLRLPQEVGEQGPGTAIDLVADRPHRLDALAGGVVEVPVLVSLPGIDRARVAAPHRGSRRTRARTLGERLRVSLRDVDVDLAHRLDHGGVDLVRGSAARGPHDDAALAWWSSRPAAIWLRPALCTQTNSTSGVSLTRPGASRPARSRCGCRRSALVRGHDLDVDEARADELGPVLREREGPGDGSRRRTRARPGPRGSGGRPRRRR